MPFLGPTRKCGSGHLLSGLESSSKYDFRYPTPRCMFPRLVVNLNITSVSCGVWRNGGGAPPISGRKPPIFSTAPSALVTFPPYIPFSSFLRFLHHIWRYIAFYDALLRVINNFHFFVAICKASCASCTRFWWLHILWKAQDHDCATWGAWFTQGACFTQDAWFCARFCTIWPRKKIKWGRRAVRRTKQGPEGY